MELAEYDSPAGPGWKSSAAVLAFYAACLVYITYPRALHLADGLPNLIDPVVHLWTMRYAKLCLAEGLSPLFCPSIQYPTGAPLGYWPSMHYEAMLYIPLSWFLSNDVLIYNILSAAALLLTGIGTYLLAWNMVRHRAAAAVGGMLAMLGPTLARVNGHLEYLHGGWFALFLLAWLKFVDRPTPGRLLRAAGSFVLMGMATQYFALFAVFPGALYVILRGAKAIRLGEWSWLRERAGWLAGFAALGGLGILATAAPNLWALGHDAAPQGSLRRDFDVLRVPAWSYILPGPRSWLGQYMPFDPYEAARLEFWSERYAYLGLVTLSLVYFAARRRAPIARRAFWWSALATLVVLSMGSHVLLGPHKLRLPADWLWAYFPPIRLTRAICRVSMLASLCAAVLAAAGLRALLERLPNRAARALVTAALVALALRDSGWVAPHPTTPMPAIPGSYAAVAARNPRAAVLDAPVDFSDAGNPLSALCIYWQTMHGLSTTSGYGARKNRERDELMVYNSPFNLGLLQSDQYLQGPADDLFLDVMAGVDFRDVVWLYLAVHKLDHVVVNRSGLTPAGLKTLGRVDGLIGHAKVFSDEAGAAYALDKLPPPARPALLNTSGWRARGMRLGWHVAAVGRHAELAAYNPDPEAPLEFEFVGHAFKEPREVTLRAGDAVLGRWRITPEANATMRTAPFRLPRGINHLVIECDSETAPANYHQNAGRDDPRPYSAFFTLLRFHRDSGRGPTPAG